MGFAISVWYTKLIGHSFLCMGLRASHAKNPDKESPNKKITLV